MGESESDGWYIDPPAAWLILHPPNNKNTFAVLRAGSATNKWDDLTFTQKGERESGFPVLVVRVDRSYFRDQNGTTRSHEGSYREEVAEFSEASLDPAVFAPPPVCRRVVQLPGGMRYSVSTQLRWHWEMLKDSRKLRKSLASI